MSNHEVFNFKNIHELENKIHELKVNISLSADWGVFHSKVKVGNKIAHNPFVILPMEGCDSELDGSPSELVRRRYHRFATGGAGLIWWEACAVVPEGKANPLQKVLNESTRDTFAQLVEQTNLIATETNGYRPLNILQLTHSGRYSRPEGHRFSPMIPQHDPLLDPRVGIDKNYDVVSDEYLDQLVFKYAKAATLAKEAGFDGVDIKACHRYLLSELLASHHRSGKYGGSFENRTRLLLNIIKAVRQALGDDFIIACRFNAFDGHPFPYGFGVDPKDFMTPDLNETLMLVKLLCKHGVELLCASAGNPYYLYPQFTRPFDQPSLGVPLPKEHPLESAARLFELCKKVQIAAGDVPVVGCGYSWLREYLPSVAAAHLKEKHCAFVGLGRQAFAYPDAPIDILKKKKLFPEKSCIACSKCTQIMRDHGRTGCVIRDQEIYLPLYKKYREAAVERERRIQQP